MLKLSLFLVCITDLYFAQSLTVSGRIITGDQPVSDAVVQLLKKDSSLAKNEFSDENGIFTFAAVDSGNYLLQVLVPGYNKFVSPVFSISDTFKVPDITLVRSEVSLKEVSVVAKKPFMEREKGKVILNVEESLNGEGSSAYDFLQKAPGVRIDNNENISVNGKPGTVVWIDGKPSPLTGADLANYLRGLSSSTIEKIEIISNPSARYDAAGSSIINIRLRKDKRIGTNGSLTVAYLQGIYPKSNNSLSLNHRDKKLNLFASYNYANRRNFNDLSLIREFYSNDSLQGAFAQNNYFRYNFISHAPRAGADYYIDKNNTIGVIVSGLDNRFTRLGTNVSQVFDKSYNHSSVFQTQSDNQHRLQNYSANLNYRHSFDSSGTELSTDLDYASFQTGSVQNIDTRYYDLFEREFQAPYLLYGDLKGSLNLFSLKNDLTTHYGKWKVEAGQKSSYVVADNDLKFYNQSNGLNLYDSTKSNHFIYTENINAGYLSVSRDFDDLTVQAGLRTEHTFITGEQIAYNSIFKRNYIQLFPNAVLTYRLDKGNDVEFNFSRRITRPGYDQLNPFKYYLDPTTFKEGYPYLQPSTTESFELSHIFRKKIATTLGFGRTLNSIIEVIAPLTDQQRVTVQTSRNLAMVDVWTLNSSIPLEITNWMSTATNFNLYYASYSGDIANTRLTNRGNVVLNFSSVNTFNFSDDFSAELSGNYQSREVYAFDIISPIWSANVGCQLKVMKNRGVIRANLTDIFYTNKIPATVRYTGYHETFLVTRDTRVATVSFTYKFGKSNLPAGRKKNGGAEDIKQRAGGNVG